MSIAENLRSVRQRMDAAARAAGRDPGSVLLVGASKMNGADACREAVAAGIDALDTVYSNLNDMETFRKEVEFIHRLGFDGKSIINPRQIEVVNEVFAPTEKAIEKAEKKGSGVIAVNGKMVDRPVVIRAQRTIDLAIASGILKEEEVK